MKRRLVCLITAVSLLLTLLAACGGNPSQENASPASTTAGAAGAEKTAATAAGPVELEVLCSAPEWEAQEKTVWDEYVKQNPNVKITTVAYNEPEFPAFQAKVAAGDSPDIGYVLTPVNKSNYKNYFNLKEIEDRITYWDKFTYDAKALFEKESGIKDYIPSLVTVPGTYTFTFVYYENEMKEAGLEPKNTVKSIDDITNMLAQLKAYNDKEKKYDYIFDTGWHPWVIGQIYPAVWATALGAEPKDIQDLFTGKIDWEDTAKNPLVPFFKLFKEYYDKGYLPQKFWTRTWDDFEAGFFAKKSILTFHGPWIWDKVVAADPNAKITGFPLPPNANGTLTSTPVNSNTGYALYAGAQGKPEWEEAVKAYIWWNSPETVKMRSEALGLFPAMDLSSVGLADLKSPQYVEVIKPLMDGEFPGKLNLDLWGEGAAGRYQVEGKPEVMNDDSMAAEYAKFFEGSYTLEQFLKALKGRWQQKYTIN
jgi:hypothetical protein